MNKPKIIITMTGGIIQSIVSDSDNTEIIVLDWDVFEDATPETAEDIEPYARQDWPAEVMDKEDFAEFEHQQQEEWDAEREKLIQSATK